MDFDAVFYIARIAIRGRSFPEKQKIYFLGLTYSFFYTKKINAASTVENYII